MSDSGPVDTTRTLAEPQVLAWQRQRVLAWSRLLVFLLVLAMGVVLARVVQLKTSPDPRLADAAGSASSSRPEVARRGDLLDRRGRVLASTSIGYRLFVDPTVVDDLQTIAVDLATVIDADPVEIDRRIVGREERRYVVIEHLLADAQAEAVRHARIPGVGLEPRPVRHYPGGTIAAGLIGAVGFEHIGLSGMEHRFDRRLHGRPGRLTYRRDASSRPLWVDPAGYRPADDGESVRLSIDLVVQEIVEERLARAVEEFNAGGGRLVVLDAPTGEVLAMHDILSPPSAPCIPRSAATAVSPIPTSRARRSSRSCGPRRPHSGGRSPTRCSPPPPPGRTARRTVVASATRTTTRTRRGARCSCGPSTAAWPWSPSA
jgi:hypothetical protein